MGTNRLVGNTCGGYKKFAETVSNRIDESTNDTDGESSFPLFSLKPCVEGISPLPTEVKENVNLTKMYHFQILLLGKSLT